MRRLLTNEGKSFVRFYDYPLRQAAVIQGQQMKASVLFSHATGFHGRVFDKTINDLDPSQFSCYTFDQRGHGQSPWPEGVPQQGDTLSNWDGFGADVLQMGRYVQQQHPHTDSCATGGVVGVGHSQGASALLLAALQQPNLFSALVLYEPVVFPPLWRGLSKAFSLFSESPLALSARKRRMEFSSLQEALKNFASKPPMNTFHADVLEDYVRHGTAAVAGEGVIEGGHVREEDNSSGDQGPVRLLCDPNVEVSGAAAVDIASSPLFSCGGVGMSV